MIQISPAIIRAAAKSSRGIFSLMCLLIGVLALAFFKDAPVAARLVVFILLVLGVAGFGYSISREQPSRVSPPPQVSTKSFSFPGRWSLQTNSPGLDVSSYIDYSLDGTFSGTEEYFAADKGERVGVSGKWKYVPVSEDEFRIIFDYDNGPQQLNVRFRIFDANRIHNIKMNCLVYRIPV